MFRAFSTSSSIPDLGLRAARFEHLFGFRVWGELGDRCEVSGFRVIIGHFIETDAGQAVGFRFSGNF